MSLLKRQFLLVLLLAMPCTGVTQDSTPRIRLSHPLKIKIELDDSSAMTKQIDLIITVDDEGVITKAKLLTPLTDQRINHHILNTLTTWRIDTQDRPESGPFELSLLIEVLPTQRLTVRGKRPFKTEVDPDRYLEVTSKRQLEESLVSSTPEALTFSTGVFVQRTAHGQGSPYIRGRTGQQTLLMFDGLRLNHALFRKGPNQYLFTVDPATLDRVEVLRGGASVEYGSDAISGAVFLHPRKPKIDPSRNNLHISGETRLQTHSSDQSLFLRKEFTLQFNPHLAVLIGVGAKEAHELQAGGYSDPGPLSDDMFCDDTKSVPCFRKDGKTQVGTGYKELTGDIHVRHQAKNREITGALYLYRQYDAPRTDQCPPPEAAIGECLVIEEQFRTHGYITVADSIKQPFLDSYKFALSLQRQHQYYVLRRPDRNPNDGINTETQNYGTDAVTGLTSALRLSARKMPFGKSTLHWRYGYDGSLEWVESSKGIRFAEPATDISLSRGQYVDGSRYQQHGVYFVPSLEWNGFRIRAGVRQSWIYASSDGDQESATQRFDKTFSPLVWNAGLRWGEKFILSASVEKGFRAPNLDDLTARQSTGQGYQLENVNLESEASTTVEAGIRIILPKLQLNFFAYMEQLSNAIERRLLSREECRLSDEFTDQACRANRAPVSLVNLTGTSMIRGFEGQLKLRLSAELTLLGNIAFARGEGAHPELADQTMPLSRIPPLNGTMQLRWSRQNLYIGYVNRWANSQTRLSVGDVADARIPLGGTPGYITHDLRLGYKLANHARLSLVLENLADQRYRSHGSGVFGPGRSVNMEISLPY